MYFFLKTGFIVTVCMYEYTIKVNLCLFIFNQKKPYHIFHNDYDCFLVKNSTASY